MLLLDSLLLVVSIMLIGIGVGEVRAQGITDVVCNVTAYSWTFNNEGQSPCQVAANLSAVCSTTGVYTVSPLIPVADNAYLPSDSYTKCECSNVVFSLLSACGLCQGALATSWEEWSTNCTAVTTSGFPFNIPRDTFVPHWAYIDVVANNRFDPVEAKARGDTPESSAATPSSTSSSGLPPATTNTQPSSSSGSNSQNANGSSSEKSSHTGAIVGGVVGGVVLLVVLGLAFFVLLKKKNNQRNGGGGKNTISTFMGEHPSAVGGAGGALLGQQPPTSASAYTPTTGGFPASPMGQRPYDPNDSSTFPTSAVYATTTGSGGDYHHPHSQAFTNGDQTTLVGSDGDHLYNPYDSRDGTTFSLNDGAAPGVGRGEAYKPAGYAGRAEV